MTEAQHQELRRARHEAWETIHRAHPGKDALIVDADIPMSAYPDMVVFAQGLVDEEQNTGQIPFRAGSGCSPVPGHPLGHLGVESVLEAPGPAFPRRPNHIRW